MLTKPLPHLGRIRNYHVVQFRSHSSLPELGHNAVESMLRVLLHLWEDPLFEREKSEIVCSIREMISSRAGFVVPNRCETWIDLHLQPEKDPIALQEAIRQIVASADRSIPGLALEFDFDFASSGYNLGTENALGLLAIYRSAGRTLRLETFRSHSDGNLFFAAGTHNPLFSARGRWKPRKHPMNRLHFPRWPPPLASTLPSA